MKNGAWDNGMLGSIEVVKLTKNSENLLKECLTSVYENVPINRLIVVDGSSADETLNILSEVNGEDENVQILTENGSRAHARERGTREAKTEWFVLVYSDVILCDEWYEKAKKFVKNDTGTVWGIKIWEGIQNPATLKLFLKITRKIFDLKGGRHDLLVHHEAIKDIGIQRNLHAFEDAFIKEWITKKDYKLVATYDPYCIHHRPPEAWTTKGSINMLVENLRFGLLRKLKLFVAYGFYTAISFIEAYPKK